ncbi:methylmalonyl-CoA epimerase [Alteraurantiacibacter aestuarii]|uniref:Methylmalonyl-CoA epimerase n=1 Tax=Alteraurantiacibacter aestuarii TaxID=650004 RepID=A0A844ZHP8_9SPHN|nr:methylmalonyl-CoA epimerase [Alteraurantiacibacter aestuarii]MXO88021.1 methylmalonyl-CoA epimerase [Alteraurantiacibacter aestuarii]
MKLGRLNHVGIAVPDMDAAIAHWRESAGATLTTPPFEMPEQGVLVCFMDTAEGAAQMELLSPLDKTSPITSFLARNPLGGQHHMCFEVPDIEAARTNFEAQGKRILGPTRIGAHGTPIFFVHPKDMGGILTEIMETPGDV